MAEETTTPWWERILAGFETAGAWVERLSDPVRDTARIFGFESPESEPPAEKPPAPTGATVAWGESVVSWPAVIGVAAILFMLSRRG